MNGNSAPLATDEEAKALNDSRWVVKSILEEHEELHLHEKGRRGDDTAHVGGKGTFRTQEQLAVAEASGERLRLSRAPDVVLALKQWWRHSLDTQDDEVRNQHGASLV